MVSSRRDPRAGRASFAWRRDISRLPSSNDTSIGSRSPKTSFGSGSAASDGERGRPASGFENHVGIGPCSSCPRGGWRLAEGSNSCGADRRCMCRNSHSGRIFVRGCRFHPSVDAFGAETRQRDGEYRFFSAQQSVFPSTVDVLRRISAGPARHRPRPRGQAGFQESPHLGWGGSDSFGHGLLPRSPRRVLPLGRQAEPRCGRADRPP
jgi:hypothetical protein